MNYQQKYPSGVEVFIITIYCFISQRENSESGYCCDLIHAFHGIIFHTLPLLLVEGCKRRVDFNSFWNKKRSLCSPLNINEKMEHKYWAFPCEKFHHTHFEQNEKTKHT